VLPSTQRLTDADSFRHASRQGRRTSSRTLVLHLAPSEAGVPAGPRVGFVVSKTVGNAVVRNRVKRRLRHLARARVPLLPASSLLVVRALPPAAAASSAELADDLDRCLSRVSTWNHA